MDYILRRLLELYAVVIIGVKGLPTAQYKPVPIQIVVTTRNANSRILRPDFTFRQQDYGLYFRKRLWRESTSSTQPLVSLEFNGEDAGISDKQFVFITRQANRSNTYSELPPSKAFSNEEKLFKSTYCNTQKISPVVYYWTINGFTSYLTARESEAGDDKYPTLTASTVAATVPACHTSGLSIIESPLIKPAANTLAGVTGQTGANRVPPVTTGQVVSYINEYPTALALSTGISCGFEISSVWLNCKDSDLGLQTTIFNHRAYDAYIVAESGDFTNRSTVTLQHRATNLFLTADVLDDMSLNVGNSLSGVKLQTFDEDEPSYSDYRFFFRYNVPSPSFFGNGSSPQNTIYEDTNILCPMYHTRYCLVQFHNGTVQLLPVNSTEADKTPTLRAPVDFSEFLATYGKSATFNFKVV